MKNPHSYLHFPSEEIEISPAEIIPIIAKVSKKSLGFKEVPSVSFRECRLSLATPLSIIFNHSIKTTEIPASWLNTRVTAIYKPGDISNPANYRPREVKSEIPA